MLAEVGEEVHLEGVGQFRSGSKREIDVAGEDLGDVRARDVHAPRELRLRHPKLLHAAKYAAEEGRGDVINGFHWTESKLRSMLVGERDKIPH